MSNLKHDHNSVAIVIPVRTYLKLALSIILTFLFLLALKKAERPIILLVTALFLALALNAPVNWLAHRLPGKSRGSRVIATSLSFLVIVLILSAFLASIVPPLVRQTEKFVANVPHLVREVKTKQGPLGEFIRHHHLESEVNSLSNQLSGRLKNIGGSALSSVGHIATSVFEALTVVVLAFMMLVEGPRWLRFFKLLVPPRNHILAERMANDMYSVVKGYVNGQVILAAIASAFIVPAVLLLHISYPAALIVVIFICGLIPMVGHTIGAVIVTLVALFHSPSSALIILIYYLIYQQIENYLIAPRVQASATRMSPLLVLASLLVGASFGGLFGGLLAIPVAGCIRIALLELLRTKGIISDQRFQAAVHETKPVHP